MTVDGSLQTDQLTRDDVAALLRVVARAAAEPGGEMARRRRVLEGLRTLLDAEHFVWSVDKLADHAAGTVPAVFVHNLSERQWSTLMAGHQDVAHPPPEMSGLQRLLTRQLHVTCRRQDLISDAAWNDAMHVTLYRRACDLDQGLWSATRADGDHTVHTLVFHRAWGRPAFTERECQLLHLACHGCRALLCPDPPDPADACHTLSPRLRTVFTLMLNGQTQRSIASELGLSTNTVSGYMKDIYRHFNVGGQVELLRRFMTGAGMPPP